MRVYAPRRAGDLPGAVPVMGADADMLRASDHVNIGARGVGDDLSDRLYPTEARRALAIESRESLATAGRLVLVLGRRPLSAAGLVMSVRYILALSAANAISL
jgi:hypothetical protein